MTTALILRFFAPAITEAARPEGFGDAFGAWLILWAIFTSILSVAAFLAFVLLALAHVLLGIANLASPGDLSDTFTRIGGWVPPRRRSDRVVFDFGSGAEPHRWA